MRGALANLWYHLWNEPVFTTMFWVLLVLLVIGLIVKGMKD